MFLAIHAQLIRNRGVGNALELGPVLQTDVGSLARQAITVKLRCMIRSLAYTSLLVPSYDDAVQFFTRVLRWTLLQDLPLSDAKRWVVVSPGQPGGALLLARASTPEQQALIGRQGGGRVWLFLHTDDLDADMAHMQAHGVHFTETPREESYGRVVVFIDPWGNRWDLIQPRLLT